MSRECRSISQNLAQDKSLHSRSQIVEVTQTHPTPIANILNTNTKTQKHPYPPLKKHPDSRKRGQTSDTNRNDKTLKNVKHLRPGDRKPHCLDTLADDVTWDER